MPLLVLMLMVPMLSASSSDEEDPRAAVRLRPTGACQVADLTPVLAVQTEPADGEPGKPRRRRSRNRFSAARTLDLHLKVRFEPQVPPGAGLELRLYTPRGHLYQTLRVEAPPLAGGSSPSAERGGLRKIRPWASATLPLAGTAIVNNSLYGRWTVEAHLDGSPNPCDRATPFWLEP